MKLLARLKESKEKLVRANNKDGYQLCVKKKKKNSNNENTNLLTIYRSSAEFQTNLAVSRYVIEREEKKACLRCASTCMLGIGRSSNGFAQDFDTETRFGYQLQTYDLCISTSERAVYLYSTKA